MEPTGKFFQRFRNREMVDGEMQFTEVEFAAPTRDRARATSSGSSSDPPGSFNFINTLEPIDYWPGDSAYCKSSAPNRVDVFNSGNKLCRPGNIAKLPAGTCPADGLKWCLRSSALAGG